MTQPSPNPGPSRSLVAVMAGATIGFIVLVLIRPEWLNGIAEYHWPILHHGSWSRLPAALFILALAVALGLGLWSGLEALGQSRRGLARAYAVMFLLGLALQLGPAAVHRNGLIELPLRIYLPDHTSYFTDAAAIEDFGVFSRAYPARFQQLEELLSQVDMDVGDVDRSQWLSGLWREADLVLHTHTRTHPPGAVALFWAAQRLMEQLPGLSAAYCRLAPRSDEARRHFKLTDAQVAAGALMALLLLLTAAAVAPLTFAIGRIFMNDQSAALAALLAATAPAFAFKTPVLDHLLGALVLLALWLTLAALRYHRLPLVAAAGAIIGAGLWLGLTLLAALPLCAIFTAAALYRFRKEDAPLKNHLILFASIMGLLAAAAAAAVLILQPLFGVSWLTVEHLISTVGWSFNNLASGRVHASHWILFNFYEVLVFAGIPLALLFLAQAAATFRSGLARKWSEVDPWTVAIVIFLLALNLSGRVCYEASRLAWFCFPLLALAAAQALPPPGKGRSFLPGLLLGGQVLCAVAIRMVF